MNKLPILFSGPMIRAILEGRKTQTRRILDPQPSRAHALQFDALVDRQVIFRNKAQGIRQDFAIRYAVGDLLWVREAWRADCAYDHLKPRDLDKRVAIWRKSDGSVSGAGVPGRLRPGMFLPRWASRITLRVTGVKVERLQDISEADAIAEGIMPHVRGGWHWHKHNPADCDDWHQFGFQTAAFAFKDLWERINGPGLWDANPWVAAYSFEPILQNVDKVKA